MKVFISWSGNRSKTVALALRDWLPGVIQTVKPWMSKRDIDAGVRWSNEVANELGETKFGIVCLTKENLNAPWVLFEAGALAKTIAETFVCPYLINLEPTDIPSGPLTQFQSKRANELETWEMVYTINKALKDNALAEDQLKKTFNLWWPDLKKTLEDLPAEEGKLIRRSVDDMVEETLQLVRWIARSARVEADVSKMLKDILDLDPKGKRKDKVQYYSLIKNDPSIMGKLYELQIDANTVKDSDVLQDEVMKLTDILKATMKEENDKG